MKRSPKASWSVNINAALPTRKYFLAETGPRSFKREVEILLKVKAQSRDVV